MSSPHPSIDVYLNPHGDVVIRQAASGGAGESTVIVPREDVQHLVDQLLVELDRGHE